LPGSYTEAHIKVPGAKNNIRLPVNTLIFRAEGMQVGVIEDGDRALLKSIVIRRDFGDSVEIASGLSEGESVILNPPDSLISGQRLRVVSS